MSRPGTAVLTGSTRHNALPRTAQALTGRLHTLTIWPLSQGEIGGVHENLLVERTRSYTVEDRLHVLPVDRLWTPIAAAAVF